MGGFETSNFSPCTPFDTFERSSYERARERSAWVSFRAAANAQLERKWPGDDAASQQYEPMLVRWWATVTGPASYGHLGGSMYDMQVTELLEVRRTSPSDCR